MRPLRSGDVVVADTTVFLDFLSRAGLGRSSPEASLNLLDEIERCCARFGCSEHLTDQWLSARRDVQRGPLNGAALQLLARLRDREKLFVKARSASRCDVDSSEYQALPPEDRFLFDAASGAKAHFIVTTDPRIPLGVHHVPQHGGGKLEVEIVGPSELIARMER